MMGRVGTYAAIVAIAFLAGLKEEVMNEDVRETPAKSTGMMGRVGTYAAIVAIAFLAGLKE